MYRQGTKRCLGTLLATLIAGVTILGGASVEAKTLRVNLKADPSSLDPLAHVEFVSSEILAQVYEGFTVLAPDGSIQPALAVKWEALPDQNGWRLHLRRNVVFHSGRPLTAWDVKYTFEELLTPARRGSIETSYLQHVIGAAEVMEGKTRDLAGVRVVDERTLEIRFTHPEALFPVYQFYIVDRGMAAEHGPDWYTKASGGTGPFRFRKWQRGVMVDLPTHERYWRGRPSMSGVQFLIVPNPETALSMFDTAELDFVTVPEPMIRRVLSDDRYRDDRLLVPRAQSRGFSMNQSLYPPFRDPRVREAVALSVDQPALARALYLDAASVASGVVPVGLGGYRPDLPPPRFDPERARTLMAEAGFPGGKGLPPLDLVTTQPIREEATYVAHQLQKVLGFDVSVKLLERGAYFRTLDAKEAPSFIWGWTAASFADPSYFLRLLWESDSAFNRSAWSSGEFDTLIRKAVTLSEPAERFALYDRAERLLLKDNATVPLPTPMYVALRKTWAQRVTLTPFGHLMTDDQAFR